MSLLTNENNRPDIHSDSSIESDTGLGLAMRMRNMQFMRIMREYADADENLIHIIHI